MGISVILLAYKEAENLKVLLPQIKENVEKCGEPYEILVIDTAKPLDNTPEVCKEFGAQYINQEEPAFGGAFRTGIKYAKQEKFLILDSDGSHPPKYIPDLYKKFTEENCDVVIGSRFVSKKKNRSLRMIGNTLISLCIKIVTRKKINDTEKHTTRIPPVIIDEEHGEDGIAPV